MTDPSRQAAARRRRIRLIQRYLINPPLIVATRLGRYRGHALIETTGRRTGRRRHTLVGVRREGDELLVVAEHGSHAGYVANLMAAPDVRVLLDRRWHHGIARLDPDTDPERLLDSWDDPAHARAVRLFATDPAVVRIGLTSITTG